MSVSDGQNVNAAVTNNAFISRLIDSSTVGKIDLNEVSTTVLIDIQRILNELLDQQGLANQASTDANAKVYSSNNVVTDGNDQRVSIGALDGAFDITTGHDHDGVNSKQVSAVNLTDINQLKAEFGEYTFDAASGTSIDVSTEFAAQTAGGDSVTAGVITSAPNNYASILEKDTGGEIENGEGDRVFARLTEAAGVWTLSFFTNEAGAETAHSLSSQDVRFLYREVFTLANLPTIGANVGVYDTQSAVGDIPDATASQRGLVSTSAQTYSGIKEFQSRPTTNSIDIVDVSANQTITNKNIDGGTASASNVQTVPSDTTANLNLLVRKAGNVYYSTDELTYYGDDGTQLIPLGGGAGGGGVRNFAQEFKDADDISVYTTGQSATWLDSGALGATFSVETTSPLFGDESLKLVSPATNDWVALENIAIDNGARGCLLGFQVNYTWTGTTNAPLLKVRDGDGNELDNNVIFFNNTSSDSKNSRVAKVVWVQPKSGTASEAVDVGLHFPNGDGTGTLIWDEIIVTDDSVTVIEVAETPSNDFSAIIANNGSASIVSQGGTSFIQSVNRTGTGIVDVTFVPGFFTEIPSLTADTLNENNRWQAIEALTTAGCEVNCRDHANAARDQDFSLKASRQGADVDLGQKNRFLVEQGEKLHNVFAARIDNNGSVSITSQGPVDFIDSVTRPVAGVVNITWKPGFFSVAPSLVCSDSSPSNTVFANGDGTSTVSTSVRSSNTSGTLTDGDIDIIVTRQGSDVVAGLGTAAIAGKTHEDDSSVHCTNASGFASTDTAIGKYDTVVSRGSSLEVTTTAANGTVITVQESGNYHVQTIIEENGGEHNIGVSVNSANLSSGVSGIPQIEVPGGFVTANTARPGENSYTTFFNAGDLIRSHGSGVSASNVARWRFTVAKIGQQPLLDAGQIKESDSEVFVSNFTSFGGSGANSIFRFDNTITNTGNNISYDEANGAWTVLKDGVYGMSGSVGVGAIGLSVGIILNSTTFDYTAAMLDFMEASATNDQINVAANKLLNAGDTIRFMQNGSTSPTVSDRTRFKITHKGDVERYSSAVFKKSSVAIIKDEKPSGTNGGTFTNGAWQTRLISVPSGDQSQVNSIISSVVNLKAGTYIAKATGAHHIVEANQLRLRDTDNNISLVVGISNDDNGNAGGINRMTGRFSISVDTNIELQHRCQSTRGTDGFGEANSFGEVEVYATLELEHIG